MAAAWCWTRNGLSNGVVSTHRNVKDRVRRQPSVWSHPCFHDPIRYGRDCVEPAAKPGDLALVRVQLFPWTTMDSHVHAVLVLFLQLRIAYLISSIMLVFGMEKCRLSSGEWRGSLNASQALPTGSDQRACMRPGLGRKFMRVESSIDGWMQGEK
jgi:hypothetical protein